MAPAFHSLILSTVFLFLAGEGLAQRSNVTCLSSYDWAKNSKGQSPCIVAAFLQSPCNNGDFTVYSLPPDYHYIGPKQNDNSTENYCICTTPVYELMSACAQCQNRTFINWSGWSQFCTDFTPITQGVFNSSWIQQGTAVPQWAFQLPSSNDDQYNETRAREVGDGPESTYIMPSHTGGSHSGTPTSSNTRPTGGGGSSNTAAIAGGVAGGVVGLALIAALAFLLLRNKGPKTAPSTLYNQGAPSVMPVPQPQPSMSPVYNTNGNPPTTYSRDVPSFPPTEYTPPFAEHGAAHGQFPSPQEQYQPRQGGYSGVPEL